MAFKVRTVRILVCPKCGVESQPRVDRPKVCWRCGYRYKDGDFDSAPEGGE